MNNIILKSASVDMIQYPTLAKYLKNHGVSLEDLLDACTDTYFQTLDMQWNMQEGWDDATLDSYLIAGESSKSGLGTYIPSISLAIDEFRRGLGLLRRGMSIWGNLGQYQTNDSDDIIAEFNHSVQEEMEDHIRQHGPFRSEFEEHEHLIEVQQEKMDDISADVMENYYGESQTMMNRYVGDLKPGDHNYRSLIELIPVEERGTDFALAVEAIIFFSKKARVTLYDPFEKGSLYPQTEVW